MQEMATLGSNFAANQHWETQPSSDYGPLISEVSVIHRGDTVMAFVIFFGCLEGQDGRCNVVVEYTIHDPEGSLYGRHSSALWVGKPSPSNGRLQLSEGNLGLKVEEDDPLGAYKITANISDRVSGNEILLYSDITVIESE
jgi:hypothetical protein